MENLRQHDEINTLNIEQYIVYIPRIFILIHVMFVFCRDNF